MRIALPLLALASPLFAQASEISAPKDNYLLQITQAWGETSSLGDLRSAPHAPDDQEVRLWVGYGLTATQGLILRRQAGVWQRWRATVVTCHLILPAEIGDTLSAVTVARYEALAKAHCGEPSAPEGRVIDADTLQISLLGPPATPDTLWKKLVSAGLMSLPPCVSRSWMMVDGTTFVLEVRKGSTYRASVIELTDPPEGDADRRIQAIAALLRPYW